MGTVNHLIFTTTNIFDNMHDILVCPNASVLLKIIKTTSILLQSQENDKFHARNLQNKEAANIQWFRLHRNAKTDNHSIIQQIMKCWNHSKFL